MAIAKVKANHNGAKNGGGTWDTRANAKAAARKIRRRDSRRLIREAQEGK